VRWLTKCMIDNCKGVLPFQEQLRAWKHRFLGYEPNYRNQPGTLADALRQVDWLVQYYGTLEVRKPSRSVLAGSRSYRWFIA